MNFTHLVSCFGELPLGKQLNGKIGQPQTHINLPRPTWLKRLVLASFKGSSRNQSDLPFNRSPDLGPFAPSSAFIGDPVVFASVEAFLISGHVGRIRIPSCASCFRSKRVPLQEAPHQVHDQGRHRLGERCMCAANAQCPSRLNDV